MSHTRKRGSLVKVTLFPKGCNVEFDIVRVAEVVGPLVGVT